MNNLDKPLRLLEYIRDFIDEHGFPPTRAEMVREHGISSTSVATNYLITLEKYGYIEMEPKLSRAIRITNESSDAP